MARSEEMMELGKWGNDGDEEMLEMVESGNWHSRGGTVNTALTASATKSVR